ncbi:GNAT family N-acetyltransferase [Ornithinimicrobium avium]|uniref:GNAT family N-acetyltransferase n=1 Tax=Ornithinimicrobium avium TaxID=2283195 RepID=A0A345NJ64_9MICO|nr:GNAT family N-acetyltransferase [Ornithinimicrobium avium]AXH95072.1 GNAT family N-acetyltransferase [Ornithinimicrobium avium]
MVSPSPGSPALRAADRAELLRLAGPDPWVRWALADPLAGEAVVGSAVAVVQRPGRRPGAWVAPLRRSAPTGPPPEGTREEAGRLAGTLAAVADAGLLAAWGARAVSVPQEHAAVAHRVLDLAEQGGDWEWMWTCAAPPPAPGEDLLRVLDDRADAAELSAFAQAHNPRVWTAVGEGAVVRWVGARDASGDLVAVGGAELEASGVAHLAGIVTATAARGRGWGRAVTSALTRWSVERHGVCTLGVFSDNATAIRLYRRLGFRTARAWHSRLLVGR